MRVYSPESSALLEELATAFQHVCVDYAADVGKFGAQHNGLTLRWLVKSTAGIRLRAVVKKIAKHHKDSSLEEKYYLLREVYALKPGVHERYFYAGHVGRTLMWIQEAYISTNSLESKATLVLKHALAMENFYDLPSFLDVEEFVRYPTTPQEAQGTVKYLLEATDWKALNGLKPLTSWPGYAPCAINEGPFVKRKGRTLFESLGDLEDIVVSYETVEQRVVPILRKMRGAD